MKKRVVEVASKNHSTTRYASLKPNSVSLSRLTVEGQWMGDSIHQPQLLDDESGCLKD